MGRRTYRLTLCYDGTGYQGWQRLPGKRTLQGTLEQALTEIFQEPVEVSGSGRTDAGVHAEGQVASFSAPELPVKTLVARLRHLLPADMGIVSADFAPERFHARLWAKEKTYVYRVWNSDQPDVFQRRYRTQIPQKLDVEAMRRGAELMLGSHDFLAFCANKQFKKSSLRTLRSLDICQEGDELRFVLTADGFLHHMVRILVGTLLEIGMHKREAEEIPEIFRSRRRENAGQTVPAGGLCLLSVRYD